MKTKYSAPLALLLSLLLVVDARLFIPRNKRQAEANKTPANPLNAPDFTSFNSDQPLNDKVL
jgi:hypothetical protein